MTKVRVDTLIQAGVLFVAVGLPCATLLYHISAKLDVAMDRLERIDTDIKERNAEIMRLRERLRIAEQKQAELRGQLSGEYR